MCIIHQYNSVPDKKKQKKTHSLVFVKQLHDGFTEPSSNIWTMVLTLDVDLEHIAHV